MPTVVLTSLSTLLTAIQSQLVAVTGFPIERVRLVKEWPPPADVPIGDQDLSVRPLGFTVLEEDGVNGAGRLETIEHRRIGVLIRTRLGTDSEQSDSDWLTNSTLGHVQLEEQVKDALHGFLPTDSQNNILVTQVMKLRDGEAYTQVPDNTEYGGQAIYFDLSYLPPLTNILTQWSVP